MMQAVAIALSILVALWVAIAAGMFALLLGNFIVGALRRWRHS